MELLAAQTCIADYQKYILNCSELDFRDFFITSDYCVIENKNFDSLTTNNLIMFLGIKNSKLIGFLVNEDVNYTDWTEETQFFEAEFKQFTEVKYKAFKDYYEKKEKPDSPFAIDFSDGINRIEKWIEDKSRWYSNHQRNRTLVKYFEIPTEDYINGASNSFNLGLLNSNGQIDLIVGNPSGLFDITRPVPPFEPRF